MLMTAGLVLMTAGLETYPLGVALADKFALGDDTDHEYVRVINPGAVYAYQLLPPSPLQWLGGTVRVRWTACSVWFDTRNRICGGRG